jgi:hypothetical protein
VDCIALACTLRPGARAGHWANDQTFYDFGPIAHVGSANEN